MMPKFEAPLEAQLKRHLSRVVDVPRLLTALRGKYGEDEEKMWRWLWRPNVRLDGALPILLLKNFPERRMLERVLYALKAERIF